MPVNKLLGREVLLTGLDGWRAPDTQVGGAVSAEKYQEWVNRGVQIRLSTHANLTGNPSNGSPVPTEKRGQLSPEFTRWMMGYPEEWASCAPAPNAKSRGLSSNVHSFIYGDDRHRLDPRSGWE